MPAYWDNSTITDNEAVLLFNKIVTPRSVSLGLKHSAMIAFATGLTAPGDKKMRDLGALPPGLTLDGARRLQLNLRKPIGVWTGTGRGAGERAAITPSHETLPRAAVTFDVANYVHDEWRDKSDFDSFNGKLYNEQVAFLTQENDAIMESAFATVEARWAGPKTYTPTSTTFGSLLYHLTADIWGLIDRTLAENVDMKANIDSSTTAITLKKLAAAGRHVFNYRGNECLALCASDTYGFTQGLVESAAGHNATAVKGKELAYSKPWFTYQDVTYVEIMGFPNGHIAMIDPTLLVPYLNSGQIAKMLSGWMLHPGYVAQMHSKLQSEAQLVYMNPKIASVFTALTS